MTIETLKELIYQKSVINATKIKSPSKNGEILRSIVNKKGDAIFHNVYELQGELIEHSMKEDYMFQLITILSGSKVLSYLHRRNQGVSAIDINNMIYSARSSGVNDDVAREIITDLLFAFSIPGSVEDILRYHSKVTEASATLYIPQHLYEDEMRSIEFQLKTYGKLSEDKMNSLILLCNAGVPKANYRMGCMYYYGNVVEKDNKKAELYLRNALSMGVTDAEVELGDLYYDEQQYEKAFECYTKPGSVAVNSVIQEKMQVMLRIKEQNNANFYIWCVLYLIMEALMFIVFPELLIAKHQILTILFTIINTLVLALMYMTKKTYPFTGMQGTGILMVIVFGLYTILCLLA